MDFIKINMDQWPRKDHFAHYLRAVKCSYSLTVNIDITALHLKLKSEGLKIYPAQIFALATIVNQLPEFRMSLNAAGELGYWQVSNPVYTVYNQATETFSVISTKYHRLFKIFYKAYLADINKYANGKLLPQGPLPTNVCNISSLPWLDFTAFNLNVYSQGDYLLPIFTTGKFIQSNDCVLMPLAIQAHHAVCDGFHVGRFIEALRLMMANPKEWL